MVRFSQAKNHDLDGLCKVFAITYQLNTWGNGVLDVFCDSVVKKWKENELIT